MRRIAWLISILLFVTLACDISVPEINLPQVKLSLPEINPPQVDLSQISIGGSQQKITGSGKVVHENRVITDYTDVTLSGVGQVLLEQGDSEGIDIEAEDNLIQHLRVEVNNGKLNIGLQPGVSVNPTRPIIFHLKIKTVEGINLSGSGSIETPGIIGRKLTVNLSGSGHIKIKNADANSITTRLNGSGDIEIGGRIQSQDITIEGSGNYRAGSLESSQAKINIPGSGSAFVQSPGQLDITISGSGTVHYIGNPEIKQNISGAGQIIKDK